MLIQLAARYAPLIIVVLSVGLLILSKGHPAWVIMSLSWWGFYQLGRIRGSD